MSFARRIGAIAAGFFVLVLGAAAPAAGQAKAAEPAKEKHALPTTGVVEKGGDFDAMKKRRVDPRPRRLQQDELLHRQGRVTRHHLRRVQAVRGRAQQEVQDRQSEDPRRLPPGRPRRSRGGPSGRERGHRGGQPDGDARAPRESGLFKPRDEERVRDRGLGAGVAAARHRGRPVRQGGLRPEGVDPEREPGQAERRSREARQAGGQAAVCAGGPRGRGPARDAQCRSRPVRRRGRLPGALLGERLARA